MGNIVRKNENFQILSKKDIKSIEDQTNLTLTDIKKWHSTFLVSPNVNCIEFLK